METNDDAQRTLILHESVYNLVAFNKECVENNAQHFIENDQRNQVPRDYKSIQDPILARFWKEYIGSTSNCQGSFNVIVEGLWDFFVKKPSELRRYCKTLLNFRGEKSNDFSISICEFETFVNQFGPFLDLMDHIRAIKNNIFPSENEALQFISTPKGENEIKRAIYINNNGYVLMTNENQGNVSRCTDRGEIAKFVKDMVSLVLKPIPVEPSNFKNSEIPD